MQKKICFSSLIFFLATKDIWGRPFILIQLIAPFRSNFTKCRDAEVKFSVTLAFILKLLQGISIHIFLSRFKMLVIPVNRKALCVIKSP